MAGTVDASAITNVTAAETGDAGAWDDIGGGPGSGQSDDQPIQGSENRGRRVDNAVRGFSFDNATGIDISASNTHVGFWVNVFQPALIGSGGLEFVLGGGLSPTTSPWSGWTFSGADYPATGGWIRVWLDPTVTRDQGDGTLSLSSVRQYGCEFDHGDISGTSDSCHLDRIDFTATGLLVDAGTEGSPAVFQDFIDADFDNSSNRYGVVVPRDGIIFTLARLTIADATLTVFNDSGFVIVFPDPPTTGGSDPFISTTFMGITVDLQNSSTDVDMANGVIKSAGAVRQGDFIVTGTSGAFDCTGMTFDLLRAITLTSACTLAQSIISASGLITAAGATLAGCTVSNATGEVGLLWDTNADPNGELDDMVFIRDTSIVETNHAIEFENNTPATITLTGHDYTGYHAMVDPLVPVTFDTETGINGTTEVVTTDKIHEYTTGDPVWVQAQGGTESPGLSDSTRYFVRNLSTTTLSFHTSSADAISDTARVDLTASGGGSGETWELYSGYAVVFNDAGKTITLNVSDGDTPTVRNGDSAATTIVNTVTVTVTVVDTDNNPIENVSVYVQDAAGPFDDVNEIIRELTNASGVATEPFAYVSDKTVTVRSRRKGFVPDNQTQTITASGLSVTVTLRVDPNQE